MGLIAQLFLSHYPSWGFETPDKTRLETVVLALITPHGDLKHRLRECGYLCRLSHYPSWGFETRGNADAGWYAYLDSLPLIEAASRRVLITPHGDLKLYQDSDDNELYICLITPHGDLKLHRPVGAIWCSASSLPLMGI